MIPTGVNPILLWLLLLAPVFSHAQLKAIQFEGLEKSKEGFLALHVQSQLGQAIDSRQVQEDLRQLQNLNAVARATYRLDSLKEGGQVLVFEIEEAISMFPILNFGGIRGNIWVQIGAKELNFRGRGEELSIIYQNNDRRHNGTIYYKVPYLRGSRWGFSTGIQRWASVEPLYFDDEGVFYDFDNNNFNLSITRAFTLNNRLEVGGSFFIENYRKNIRHLEEITPGPDEAQLFKFLFKINHHFNRLSYRPVFMKGWDNRLYLQRIWTVGERGGFNVFFNDTRYFKQIGKHHNLAFRLRLGVSTNNDSPFAPFVLDSHVNIRGAGNRIDRGTAMAVLNAEYRHVLFDRRLFAAQVVGFSDSGTWREPGGKLQDLVKQEKLILFAGGGLRLIYKKAHNAVLRVDYGVDLYGGQGNGWVLGLGQYF